MIGPHPFHAVGEKYIAAIVQAADCLPLLIPVLETPLDVTEMDPSWAWAAGQIVSTPRDMDRFTTALFGGDLLASAQLEQMRTTVDTGVEGVGYGLGVFSRPLSCGRSWECSRPRSATCSRARPRRPCTATTSS